MCGVWCVHESIWVLDVCVRVCVHESIWVLDVCVCVCVCVCDSKCIVRQLLGIGTVMYVYLLTFGAHAQRGLQ